MPSTKAQAHTQAEHFLQNKNKRFKKKVVERGESEGLGTCLPALQHEATLKCSCERSRDCCRLNGMSLKDLNCPQPPRGGGLIKKKTYLQIQLMKAMLQQGEPLI